jgi:hypothetical protein
LMATSNDVRQGWHRAESTAGDRRPFSTNLAVL